MIGSYVEAGEVFSRFRKNIFWMNLYQGINIATSLVVSVAFARLASRTVYGQYIFVVSLLSFISLVSMPGVRTTIFRSVSQGDDGFYAEATRFSMVWSLLGVPVLLASGLYFYHTGSHAIGAAMALASLFFPFMYSLQNWKNFYKAKERFREFVVYESSISVTKAVLVIGLLFLNPENLVLILAVYFLATSVFNGYFFLRSLDLVSRTEPGIEWRQESYEYTLLNLTSYTFSKIDRILVGLFLPFSQVAIYNIAMKITDSIFKFMKSSIEAVLPGFFNEEYGFSRFYPVFVLLFVVPLALYPVIEYPILFLYTEKYSASVLYAKLYLFAVPFYFMAYVSGQALVKESLSREVNIARISSIAVYVALALVLIPRIGVMGGVVASLVYYPVQVVFCGYYMWRNQLL